MSGELWLHISLILRSSLIVFLCLSLHFAEAPAKFISWLWIAGIWAGAFVLDLVNAFLFRRHAT